MSPFNGLAAWYSRVAAFNVESLFARRKVAGKPRSVFVHEDLPQDYYDHKQRIKKEHVYPTNQVITSKYTIITFLPRNLLEQFRRIANIFFLAIAILQFFNIFSTVSPGLVILPLIIVLAITALKDGYEDIKRHQSDRSVNYSQTRVLAGGEYTNPNAMQGKSKTFVRGFVPKFVKGEKKSSKKVAGGQSEVLELQHAAPPEGIPEQGHYPPSPTQTQTDDEGIEYDDDEPIEGQEHHHRHSIHIPHPHLGHSQQKRPHWKYTTWEDVRVGDIVKIMDNDSIPADILICATSEDENVAFVETKNLDGETNLKSRTASPVLTHLRTAQACADPRNAFRVDCGAPDTNLYKLEAAVVLPDDTKSPVDISMMLLRGTVLRNTGWVVGVVLYTGEDTKIVMNSGITPSKRSKVERQMNPQVFINLIILACMAVACGIADSLLEQHYFPLDAPWLYGDTQSDDNPRINGLVTWAFALITFQNIVPISLYISIEFVRTIQALWIYFDKEICYENPKNGSVQPTLARSWNLSDDLGQIEYIFSDKTGTLTQNAMVFRECSVGGKVYRGDRDVDVEEVEEEVTKVESAESSSMDVDVNVNVRDSHTGSGSSRPNTGSSATRAHTSSSHPPSHSHSPTNLGTADPKSAKAVKLSEGVLQHFIDHTLKADLQSALTSPSSLSPSLTASPSPSSSQAQLLIGFWTTLALCHTVLTSVDPETGAIEYKAQSPDEAALVQAAADVGFVFRGREKDVLSLTTSFSSGGVERWELMHVLEFNSSRKRMSVVVRKLPDSPSPSSPSSSPSPTPTSSSDSISKKPTSPAKRGWVEPGTILLLTKGADNVIFERLAGGSEGLKRETEQHLAEFASEGLRTLTLAYKVIPEEEYAPWVERYASATVSLTDRETLVERTSNELEQSLHLLGATAIEDRLQDGVPETIADLKEAGIKIWVATGDKLETAIAIGHSTNLIGREDNIVIIRGQQQKSRSVYAQMLGAVQEFFPQSGILEDEGVKEYVQLDGADGGSGGMYPLRRVNTGVSDIVGRDNGSRPGGFVLVIDGAALTDALSDEPHKHLLLKLAMQCEGVICCRVSPLQKALIVKLVKDGLGSMTLAIGDGANDVSMIQAADVGVGISGEEGLQAVNSSDYAIAQFRFLKRLLLVHGHWSYARNGNMIVNFFYKNIVCIGALWWFQIYCAWSSQYVFEYTYLLFWNSFWTIAPVIAIGLFDRVVDDHVLMSLPELYAHSRRGEYFGITRFLIFMIDGIYQSAIVFFLLLYTYFTTTSRTDGYAVYQYEFSTTMAISAVMVVTIFNGLSTAAWTGWVFFALGIEVVLIWAYTAIYSIISPGWFVTPIYGNDHYLFTSAYYWLGMLLVIPLALLPRYAAKAYKFNFMPSDIDRVRYIHKLHPERDFTKDRQNGGMEHLKRSSTALGGGSHKRRKHSRKYPHRPTLFNGSRTDMSTGLRSQSRGFDFAMEENGPALRRLQSNLSEKHGVASGSGHGEEERRKRSTSLLPSFSLSKSIRRNRKPPQSSPLRHEQDGSQSSH
ncbi:phospholipid-translocating P-type ATPase [Panus rudis PR-1116 ss-1]|nr:phospholipid-translocating P-type ATPase [Panus rudis PR-1116 ss-1]